MRSYLVDTNVAVTANDMDAATADPACVQACTRALLSLRDDGCLLLDDEYRILGEYSSNLRSSGQPGVGDAFLRWALQNQANAERCRQVAIQPRGAGGAEDYEEFPEDPELAQFDPPDRKYVAVALASGDNPEILNATDRDWWLFREPLERNGVRICFLCPQRMDGDPPPPVERLRPRRPVNRRGGTRGR